jgi:hypothetical protein
METRTIILLSCSHDKQHGGGRLDRPGGERSLLSNNLHASNRVRLLDMRNQIRGLLKGDHGRLCNADQKGGYRDERSVNRNLLCGPDFGGTDPEESHYMLAYERYNGRFFQKLRALNQRFWEDLDKRPVEMLFVSGLYGLLLSNEAIQDYDCHLGDDVEGMAFKGKVADLWQERYLLTDVLCDFINTRRASGSPVHNVFDMLSEDLYQNVFN